MIEGIIQMIYLLAENSKEDKKIRSGEDFAMMVNSELVFIVIVLLF